MAKTAKAQKDQKTINLALQGGGAHGAFTWGVLDMILDDGRLDVDGITASSAGAMNAAAFAQGKSVGGREKAREVLEEFWREISRTGAFFRPPAETQMNLMQSMNPFAQFMATPQNYNFIWMELMRNMYSPYDFNPFNINPLREVLDRILDFDEIHACQCVELFISATDVQHGTSRIFRNQEVTIDTLLASACLPFLFQAQEIDDHHFWDGGYMGNPALWPLFYHSKCRDILIIHVNPIHREEIPKDAYAIENRINEITFNAALLKELRAIAFVKKLIREDMLKDEYKDQYTDVLVHAIRAESVMTDLSLNSKFDTDWGFLSDLRDEGREAGKNWLKENYKHVNKKDSVDIGEEYLSRG